MHCQGYNMIYMPNHPRAFSNGYVYEHLLVAEEMLGRPLAKGEVVHHIDHNRLNNIPSNLMVFRSTSDHTLFHHTGKAILVGDVYVGCSDTDAKLAATTCPICGKYKNIKSALCAECYNKDRRKNIPEKSVLESYLRMKIPFTTIGAMYNVTDKAVRKWCRSYGLPLIS